MKIIKNKDTAIACNNHRDILMIQNSIFVTITSNLQGSSVTQGNTMIFPGIRFAVYFHEIRKF